MVQKPQPALVVMSTLLTEDGGSTFLTATSELSGPKNLMAILRFGPDKVVLLHKCSPCLFKVNRYIFLGFYTKDVKWRERKEYKFKN